MGIPERKEKRELIKHVNAIHSAAPLTLLQRKINNALLFHAYPLLTKQEVHTITITELCRMIHYEGHNYAALKDAILGLLNTVIQWNIVGDNCKEEIWRAGAIISFVEIKGSTCTYYYSKPLRELLYEPSVYGRISMIVQSSFTSSYALALYENCVRYIGIPNTKWFDYQVFRKLMGVVDESKYPIFKDFRKRVIDRAVTEVNLRSSIEVTPEYRKAGRKIIAIRFLINEKGRKAPLGRKTSKTYDDLQSKEREIVDVLKQEFDMSPSHTIKLLREYGQNYIAQKISILKKTATYKQGKIKSPAYLISLLKNDAQEPKSLEKVGDIIQKRREQAAENANKQNDLEVRKKQDYYKLVMKKTFEVFYSLSKKKQNELLSDFIKKLEEKRFAIVLQEYKKHGLDSAIVSNSLASYLKEQKLILDISETEEATVD